MKKLQLLLTIIICQISFGQQYIEIDFNQTKDWGTIGMYEGKTRLIQNGSQAIYTEIYSDQTEETNTEDGNLVLSLGSGQMHFYKNYTTNELFYENTIQFKHFPTKEKIDLIKWTILPNKTKDILGYKCQVAVTEFRGRTFEAYFTEKLGFTGGPWKFDGLPGMILEVNSTDGFLNIKANSIKIIKKNLTIENPYKNTKNFISYLDFESLYSNKYKEVNRTEVLENGGTSSISMPKCQIECFVD